MYGDKLGTSEHWKIISRVHSEVEGLLYLLEQEPLKSDTYLNNTGFIWTNSPDPKDPNMAVYYNGNEGTLLSNEKFLYFSVRELIIIK